MLSESKCRLSISGWFHGPPAIRPPPTLNPEVTKKCDPVDIGERMFNEYINCEYLDPGMMLEIQASFEEESEIQLYDFLRVSLWLHHFTYKTWLWKEILGGL